MGQSIAIYLERFWELRGLLGFLQIPLVNIIICKFNVYSDFAQISLPFGPPFGPRAPLRLMIPNEAPDFLISGLVI